MNQHRPGALVLDAAGWAEDADFAAAVHSILAALVRDGAALGWIDPPPLSEVEALLASIARAAANGDAALRAAYSTSPPQAPFPGPPALPPAGGPGRAPPPATRLIGLGYWTRYERPTHWPHANVRRIAVAAHAQGRGVGRAVTQSLVDSARAAGVEVVTLDARGDNANALRLYQSLGFFEYGRLKDFVAVGDRRYDMVLCALDLREPGSG